MDNDDWQPPSEAEMKLIKARRDRSDKISKIMSGYLLKGYKMLGSVCTTCDTILLQDRQGTNYCVACSELDSDTDKDNPLTNQSAAQSKVKEMEFSSSALTSSEVTPKESLRPTPQSTPQHYQSPAGGDAVRPKVYPANVETTHSLYASPQPQNWPLNPDHQQRILCGATAASEFFIKQEIIETDPQDSGFPSLAESRTSSIPQQRTSHANTGAQTLASSSPETSAFVALPIARLLEKIDWASKELKDTASVEYSVQLCLLIKAAAEAIVAIRHARM
ncbi:unnamed protein product [Candidula unifasciata]|uniref:Sjoegren syndrome/scleroderma autoantigen 1 n=1 Tax=Candidula unifasciata TaxID=100452 RepID=A0A8S3ZEE3_9EUPU|nr:unnamed protein product [Candidula unifasciata]